MSKQKVSEMDQKYISILQEEMVVALGCTEPIAIAYAAAKAREALGKFPESAMISCSGNIIKNAMGVVVPNIGGMKGIKASVIAGLIGGSADHELEVLSSVEPGHLKKIQELVDSDFCQIKQLDSDAPLHIIVSLKTGNDTSTTEIKHAHTNVYRITKNDQILFENIIDQDLYLGTMTNRDLLTVEGIFQFAERADIDEIKELLERQIAYNMAIAEEGLAGHYGVRIGKTLLQGMPDCTWTKSKAYTAAASEARMSGSIMPVVTNSGSGNQGITCSVPVIVYAREHNADHDALLRALVLSNLLTIHQKTKIGRLSAFCGAVSAGCAAGAAISYLAGGGIEEISRTVTNTLANIPGIICDGAKPSCAAKIASSVDAGIMAHLISMDGSAYEAGSGIIKENVEETISMVGSMASNGMADTDIEILRIMLEPK